jgi:hypothetical protein
MKKRARGAALLSNIIPRSPSKKKGASRPKLIGKICRIFE